MSHKMFNHSRGGYKANIKQPPRRGQSPKRGQKCCSQSVLSSEVPLYSIRGILYERSLTRLRKRKFPGRFVEWARRGWATECRGSRPRGPTAISAVIQQTLDLTEGCVYRDVDSEFNSWRIEGFFLKRLCSLVAV